MLGSVAMIAINGLAANGLINGVTPDVISERYPTVVTPAAYAFSIWSLIYFGLAAFSIYQLLPAHRVTFGPIRGLVIVGCALNIVWIFLWQFGRVGISALVIAALTISLVLTLIKTKPTPNVMESWLVKGTFGLYAGWVTTAAVVNLFVFLASIGYPASDLSAVIVLILLSALSAVVAWKMTNYFFPLAAAWALTAIAVKQSGNTAVVLACAFGVVVCLVAAISFVLKLPSMYPTHNKHE
jgi:hypothetical protein